MEFIDARNPAYTQDGRINLEVMFDEFKPDYIPFTASIDDDTEHGKDLFTRAVSGEFGEVAPYIDTRTEEDIRGEKLVELKSAFSEAAENAHCLSSIGFEIDANETANRNVESLIRQLKKTDGQTATFRDYNNEYHTVTLEDVETIQADIDANGSRLYALKWGYEAQVMSIDIDQIDTIEFIF